MILYTYSFRLGLAQTCFSAFLIGCFALPGRSQTVDKSYVILPPGDISVAAGGSSRILVEQVENNKSSGDLTQKSRFSVKNNAVAKIDSRGNVTGLTGGTTEIIAMVNGVKITRKVRVNPSVADVSFRNQVLPILTKAACNSGACHGAAAGKGGLRLTLRGFDPAADYDSLVRQSLGRRVRPGQPDQSLILLKPTMAIGHGGGERFKKSSMEYKTIASWISHGAKPPTENEVLLNSVEIFPRKFQLKPGAMQSLIAIGRYSNGTSRDVTRWVKFGVADGSVAVVDDNGIVKGVGLGETAVTAWYSSKVNLARVISPFGTPAIANNTAQSIDGCIDRKLAELGLSSSRSCDDSTFLRRAYLDLTGALPNASQRALVNSGKPLDRSAIISQITSSPEFIDYWTYKWSDMLLLSSKKMAGPALTSFYGWIRDNVERNRPWNEFAQDILTATGSNLDNGAANFYLLHKDPIDALETTTQAFMGLSLTCARCHNHPLEKWTQKNYYEMANLYSRVRLKSGDRAGETLALISTEGNINHPRLGYPLPPKPLDGDVLDINSTADRRIALANWLTSPKNEYFSRAIINRVWKSLMGRGLMEPEDDLRQTNPASNEELMAHLTAVFVSGNYPQIAGRPYDINALISYIASSKAYQRSSEPDGLNVKDDKFYSRYVIRRLSSEAMLDAISSVTGSPTEFAGYPKGTRSYQLKDSLVTNYFLSAFGRPERVHTCSCERQEDPNVAQALHLVNGTTIQNKLQDKNGVIAGLVKRNASPEEAIETLFVSALCRKPTEKEMARLLSNISPETDPDKKQKVYEDLFWAVLTDLEFLYNH